MAIRATADLMLSLPLLFLSLALLQPSLQQQGLALLLGLPLLLQLLLLRLPSLQPLLHLLAPQPP
jgi:hypothetical protein